MYKLHSKCTIKKDTAQDGSASGHCPQHPLTGRAWEKLAPRGEAWERWVGVSLEASRWLEQKQMMPGWKLRGWRKCQGQGLLPALTGGH